MGRHPGILHDFGQRCCVCRCHRKDVMVSCHCSPCPRPDRSTISANLLSRRVIWNSSSRGATSKVHRYSQSRSATHCTRRSLSPTKGSGMRSRASRSVWTEPGAWAGSHSSVPASRNCRLSFRDCVRLSPLWNVGHRITQLKDPTLRKFLVHH